MANKFDIDSSADTHLLNETFHVFSKSPGSPTTTLGGARLKSGHTTTATDVWADEIPAFFNAATQAKFDLFQSKAVKDDLCLFDGKVYQHNGTAFVSLGTTDTVLVDGKTFSKNNKAVVKYHKGRTAINLTADNNNGDGSNNYTAKIYNAATGSTTFVPQFISAMDKIVDGIPSLAYDAVVSDSTGVLAEGLTADNDYICNSYAGVIQFNKTRSQDSVTVSAWEYIGEKLTTSLTELAKKIESVTATAGEGVQAVTDAATAAGLSVSTKEITVEGETDPITVKALDIAVANVSDKGVITGGDETKLVTATGAQNIANKAITDAVDDGSVIDTRIDEVINAATLTAPSGSSDAIKDAEDTSKLVTAEQVKTYVTNNAQVTVKVGETVEPTTNLELAGSTGSDVTITATADTADGYKVTFGATIDKATVTDGVIDATTGNGDKVISATAAKSVAEKAIETALGDTADGSLGATIASKVADVTVDDTSIVGTDKVAKLTTTGTDEIEASSETNSTKLATEASVAKALASITSVGVSYKVLGDDEKHESVTAPVKGCIYLEKDENAADGTYIEWFYTGTAWEKIGSTKTDHSGYAKNITINGELKTVSNNAVDLGKAATSVTAGNGITSGTVSDTGALSLTLTTADTTTAGITRLTDAYTENDDSNAATGKSIAAAIATLAATDVGEGAVKVSQTDGKVTSVTVATEALVDEGAIKETTDSDTALITASDALEAIKLAKPENYISTVSDGETDAEGNYVNVTSGETKLVIKDGRENVYPNDLWGTTVSLDGNTIIVQSDPIDGSIWGPKNGYNTKGDVKADDTTYPQGSNTITKVENNMVYNGTTEVANIKTNEIVDGSYMFDNTSLESFSGDLSNLVDGSYMFDNTSLESFSGDLSNLVDGSVMFSGCSNLTSFSANLPSLTNGSGMFQTCTNLTSFSANLPNLTNALCMFYKCSLPTFGPALSSLTNALGMFYECPNLTEFSSELSSLANGAMMFRGCSNLTEFSSDLRNLVNGYYMFYGTSLTSFNGDLRNLVNGSDMFYGTSLTSFSGDMSSLVYGYRMFRDTPLTSFSGDMSSLVDGSYMFDGFKNDTPLASFSGDLSSLVNGYYMFYGTSLTSFNGDLSNLVNGSYMFNQTSLASFSGDLSNLVNGSYMFNQTSLASFSGDLSNLVNGSYMFNQTSLDVDSVELICDVLPNYNTENGGKQLQTATWNESGENKGKYTYSDWASGDYNYPIIKIIDEQNAYAANDTGIVRSFGTEPIAEANVKTISIRWKDISVLSEDDRKYIAELFTNTANEKGWTFLVNTEIAESGEIAPPNAVMATDGTIQYYVFAKKDEATEDNATHIDASGKLWKFDTAEAIIGPNIKYWSMFATVEDALTEWGLTPWTKPIEEEIKPKIPLFE